MPVTAKVAPHGQLAEQETVLREVDTIALNRSSDVSLDLHPRDIEVMTRQGDNLLVTLENGELITVENFYADPTELSHLYLQGDEFAGELFQVGLGEAGAGGAVPFTSTATLTTAETALTTTAAGAGTAGAGAATGAGTVAGISTAGLVAGGVAVAAGVGVAAATGDDSSSSDEDTTAPEAPVLDETNGNILTGSSEPGATIEVTNAAGDSVGSAVADADGNFSVELSPAQAAGTELTATATDAAGNVSEASTAVTVPQDADITAPNTPTIAAATDDVEAITGALEDGDNTNDTTPTLGGTAEVGSTVTVTLDGDVIGTTTADSNGAWSFTPNTELGDGEHVFSVTATDEAGNESPASGEFTLTVDTTSPDAPVLSETDGTTASGTAEAGSNIEITNSNGDSVGTGIAEDDGTFSIELDPPQQDDEALTATATDSAGNISSSSTPATVDTSTDSTAPNTPTITSATDDVDAITGALENGGSTNDATPTLIGSAEAGSSVTVSLDGEVIGTTTADSNGAWRYTPSTDLTDGDHVFSVTATDAAGNESAASGEFTLTVDTTAPDAPVLSETDGETANGSTVNGSAEAGGTVEITNGDGDLLGSGTIADDGTFSITLSPKQEAGAELTATVTDAAGNESPASDTLVVPEDADVTAPNTPTITSATDDVPADTGALASGDSTNDATPTLIGSAEAGSSITITHNGEVVDSVTADANGAWRYTPSTDLTDGEHVFSVTATDAVGNESAASGEFTLTVDTIAPDAPILSETDGETANGSTVNGSAEAGGTVEITNGDGDLLGSGTVAEDGTFSITLSPKQEAGAELTATVTDAAGNESPVSDTLVVPEAADVTAPNAPTIASATDDVAADTGALASGDSTNDATPTLTGSAEAGSTVTITHNGEVVDTVMADANGSWSYTPSTDLTDDEHVFSVTATDAAGNESASSGEFTLTVDTTAPDAPVLSETDGTTVAGTGEAGTTVEITNASDDVLGTAVVDAEGNFSVELSPEQEAGSTLTATATDAAGNESAASAALDVPVDADVTAPNTPTITSATDDVPADTSALDSGDSTNDATPTLTGSAEAGSTVTITHNGEVVDSVTADANGAWRYTPSTDLTDGDHVFSVTATDAAGNESAASGEFTLTVDTTAPDAPVLSETDGETANGSTVNGSAEAGGTVEITNGDGDLLGSGTIADDGTFSITLSPKQEAGAELTATVTDAAGNESPVSDTLVVPEDADVTAPNTPTIASATDDVEANTGALASGDNTNDATPTLIGSAEANSNVTITHNGEVVDSVTADANGAWSYTPSAELTDGEHVFSVTATDAAGNESASSGEFTLTVDTTAPDAPILSETDGETANGSTVNGSAEAGGTVEITNGDGDLLGSGTVAEDGTFSITLSPKQEAGAELTATVTDAAGNESPVSDTLVVPEDADVTAPNTPTITSATDDVPADTGALASGDSTNDAAPTLIGSAEANSTVTITHNGEEIATVTADTNGAWRYTPSTELTDGDHIFSVTATDAAGNESPASGDFTLTVDTTAPDAPVLSETDGTTVAGTGEAGTTVEITNANDDVLGTAVVDAEGNFSVELSPEQEAGSTLTATATDAAGNESAASAALDVPEDADVTAPNTPTITSATDDVPADTGALASGDSTNDATPTLTGSAEAGSTVTITHNGEVVDTVVADANGAWRYTPSTDLIEGEHVFSVTATDAAGNESPASGEFTLTIDTTAPDAPVLSETDGETANGSTVNGSAEAGGTVEITNGDGDLLGSGTVADDGTFSITLSPKQEAGAELTATVTDAAGNESPVSDTLVVPEAADVTAPNTPTITSATDDVEAVTGALASGDSTNDSTPTLIGSAEAGSTVTIAHNGEVVDTVEADANGSWSYTPSTELTDGEHIFSVTATDAAGNESPASGEFTLTVDTTAPDAPVLSETDGTTVAGTGEAGTTVEISNANDDVLGTAVVDAEGNFSVELSPEQEAGSTLTATATDAAGNESAASAALDVPEDADVTAPNTPTITSATDDVAADTGALASGDSTNDATPTLTGSAEANSTVTITHNGEVVDSVTADANGSWSYTPSTDLTDGEHVFSVTATDAAGNESASSGEFTLTVDTAAPDAPVLSETDGTTVAGTGEAGTTVEITNANDDVVGTAVVDTEGNFSVELSPEQEAGSTLTATATDAAGNESAASAALDVPEDADVTAPNTPTITSATDDVSADTGTLASGDSTNDATPTLTGSAEAGSTVNITHNGEEIATVTADANGAWRYTPSTDLTEGEHVFSVTATDAAGNESAASGEFTLTVDTTAPDAPVLSETDGTTVAGTGEAGTTVEITNASDDVLGTAVVDAEGNFSVELSPEQEAGSTLTATTTDAAGNESAASAALDVPLDADVTAPNTPTIASATDDVAADTGALASGDSTNDATPTLTGSAEANSTVTITHNGEEIATVTADANGAWSHTPSTDLIDGDHIFSVTATDAAGNESASSGEFTLTVDTTVPTNPALALTTDTNITDDGITSNGDVTVSGLEADASWEYSLDGGSNWIDDTGTSFTLAEGSYADGDVQIRQTDVAGNVSDAVNLGAVTVDATIAAPSVSLSEDTNVTDDGITSNGEVTVSDLEADASWEYSLDGGSNWIDGTGTTFTLAEGVYADGDVQIRQTDVAGNVSDAVNLGDVTVDATIAAPSLALTADTNVTDDGITSNGEVTVSGLEADASWEYSLDGGSNWIDGTGTTFTLAEGVYDDGVVQIRQTDVAGNVSDAVNLGAVTVDATAPTGSIAFVDGDDGLLNLADISAVDLTGSIEAGLDSSNVVITITDSADPANEITVATTDITVDGAGNLSVTGLDLSTATSGLTEGALTVSMTVTDVAGNTFETDDTTTSDLTVPETPSLALSEDTNVTDDGITSNGEVTVSGLEADATWEYSLDGGSNWIDGTGTTFTLAEGVYADGVVQIRQTDVAGNVSDAVNLGAVTVDNTAPGAPPTLIIDEALNGVNIEELTDGLQAEVALSADTVAGDTATVTLVDTDDADNVITADVALVETDIDAGTVTVTIPADTLTDGSSYNASAVITDAAGNVSNEVNLGTVTIDTTAPTTTVTIDSISDDTGLAADDFITNDDDGLTVTATLSAELATGEALLYSTDGTTWVDITDSVSGTAVSYADADLTASATVQLKVQDAAGNDGDIESQDVVIDTTAPTGSLINFTDADGDINAAEATDVTFEGTVEAGLTSSNLTIVITDTDNGSVSVPTENITVSAAGEVTVSGVDLTGLAEGLLTVTMTVTDDAGNENVAAVTDTATKLSDDFLDLGNANRLTISEALIASAAGAVASTQTFADTSGEATLSLSSTESLTSNGQALDWVVTDEGRTLTLASDVDNAAATAVMVVSVTEDGSEVVYSAELLGNIDQANAESSTVDVLVTLSDGTSSTSSTLNIDIADDVPTIAASTVVETLSSNTDYTGSIFDGEDDFGFGADAANGQVQSFTFKGLTFTVSDDGTYADVTGTSTEIGLEAGDTVSIVDGILAVETLSGESFSLNIDSGDYSYSHQGQFSTADEANSRPIVNVTETDDVLGIVGANVLSIVDLNNNQLYNAYDVDNNLASVSISTSNIYNTVSTYLDGISDLLALTLATLDAAVPLVDVPTVEELLDTLVGNSSWTYSAAMASELGLVVTTQSGVSTETITITKTDGSQISNLEINEILASIDFTISTDGILSGLLDILDLDAIISSILSTTSIAATDTLDATSDVAANATVIDLDLDLFSGDYQPPIKEGDEGEDTLTAASTGESLYGYGSNDELNGGTSSDLLRGGSGNDELNGGGATDLLIGGADDDTLDGGDGVDILRWESSDEGTVAAAATDTVLNFNNGGVGSGDILDLRDMLNGAYYVDSATNNLASYISAEYVSATGTTVLYINTEGGLTADPAASANQVINIDGLDLTEGGTLTSSEVIDSLISGDQLLVGTEVNESDVSVTVVDGDGDTATGEITFVGEESLDAVTNTAPIVTLQDSELLGLVGLEALDLIDLSNNKVFVADPDNNLREVVINYAALVDVNLLTGVFTDPEFTWDNDLATSLGLSVTPDDNGVLGIIATTAELTITATDGGDIDNLALNQFLATVGFSDGGISDLNLANIDLLDAYSITATDAYDASTTDAISSLAGVELLDSNEPLFSGIDESNTFIGSLLTDDEIDISANLEGSAIFGLSGNDSLIGGLGNDVIRGGEGDDSLVGNAGDDLLIGDSGSNTFDGGAGDDLIVTSSLDFTIEGGADIDTVSFDGTGKGIDLVALSAQAEPSVMTNIEVLDISASSETGTSLKIDADTVLNLTDGDNELYIDGDEGDSVEAAGATSSATTTEFNGTTYDTYQLGEATLYIDQDVTVNTSNG